MTPETLMLVIASMTTGIFTGVLAVGLAQLWHERRRAS